MFKINVRGSIEKLREKFGSALRIDENGEVFIDLENESGDNINNSDNNKNINNNKDNKNKRQDGNCQQENIEKIEKYCVEKEVTGLTPLKTAQVWLSIANGCVKTVLAAIDYMVERRDVYGANMYSPCGYITTCLKRGFKASESAVDKAKSVVKQTYQRAKSVVKQASGAVKNSLPEWVASQPTKSSAGELDEDQKRQARELLMALGELQPS